MRAKQFGGLAEGKPLIVYLHGDGVVLFRGLKLTLLT